MRVKGAGIEADMIFANGRWILICILGGLTGDMSIHRSDRTHKVKSIPFELHRRTQYCATIVGGPAIEYGSRVKCQVEV